MLKIGVFRLDDGESGIISNYCGRGLISNHSDFSEVFWPPPRWLFSDDTCPSGRVDGEDSKEDTPELHNAEENSLMMNGWEQCDDGVDVPWSDIPSRILTEIAKYLKAPIDICRFRAVCKKWRTSFPPPRNSNLLPSLLPYKLSTSAVTLTDTDMFRSSKDFDNALVLVASTVYLIRPSTNSTGPSKSWLVTVEEVNPGKLFLRMPLRRFAIENLPDNFPKVWDLSNFHVSAIGRDYNFRYANSTRDMFPPSDKWSFCNSHRVVLPTGSACASSILDYTTALVWYDFGNLVSFSLRDESRSPVRCGGVSKFDDVINFKGKIYAIDLKGRLYVIDCGNPSRISRVMSQPVASGLDMQKRLVGSDTGLYLLVRHSTHCQISFQVYKLSEKQDKWEEVKSLDDQILFVTTSFCFLAPARDFPGWKGNCIVFPENTLPTHTRGTLPDWIFFKRIIEELRIGVFYLGDNDSAKVIQSYPGYSDLFWPPPPWLKLAECTPRNNTSPDSLANSVEGPKLDNLLTTAQQGEAAESETKSLVTLPVQHSKARAITGDKVYLRSELVPILHKIWDKQGDITEPSTVTKPETVAQAFESLAEAVLIFKTTPWRSLNELQAGFLRATLSDLRQKQFRVDWLSPLVEKALSCQQLLSFLDELKKGKSFFEDLRRQVLEVERSETNAAFESVKKAGIEDMNRKLDDAESTHDGRIKSVEEMIRGLGPIDLDSCIGEGLC